jgi:hypothetical protein
LYTVQTGDGLHGLLLLPVVVQVQLQHTLLKPSHHTTKSAKTINHN